MNKNYQHVQKKAPIVCFTLFASALGFAIGIQLSIVFNTETRASRADSQPRVQSLADKQTSANENTSAIQHGSMSNFAAIQHSLLPNASNKDIEELKAFAEQYIQQLSPYDIAAQLIHSDPKFAMELMLEHLNAKEFYMLFGEAFTKLAEDDPEYAATLASQLNDRGMRDFANNRLAEVWSERDIRKGFQWLEQLPDDIPKASPYYTLMDAFAKENPEAAAIAVNKLDPGFLQNNLISSVTRHYGKRNNKETWEWLKQLQASGVEIDPAVSRNLIQQLAESNPEDALNKVIQGTGLPGEEYLLSDTLKIYAEKKPKELLKKYTEVFPDRSQNEITSIIAKGWVKKNEAEFNKWVTTLSKEEANAAYYSLADEYSIDQPQKSLIWANSIQDTYLKKAAMEGVFSTWSNNDLSAAYQALVGMNINSELRFTLEQIYQNTAKRKEHPILITTN